MLKPNGVKREAELKRLQIDVPVTFIAGTRDVSAQEQLLQRGAIGCFIEPLSDSTLLKALRVALKMQ